MPAKSLSQEPRGLQNTLAVDSVPWVWLGVVLKVPSAVSAGRQLVCSLCMIHPVMTLGKRFAVVSRRYFTSCVVDCSIYMY